MIEQGKTGFPPKETSSPESLVGKYTENPFAVYEAGSESGVAMISPLLRTLAEKEAWLEAFISSLKNRTKGEGEEKAIAEYESMRAHELAHAGEDPNAGRFAIRVIRVKGNEIMSRVEDVKNVELNWIVLDAKSIRKLKEIATAPSRLSDEKARRLTAFDQRYEDRHKGCLPLSLSVILSAAMIRVLEKNCPPTPGQVESMLDLISQYILCLAREGRI